jgi:hypothetical protein
MRKGKVSIYSNPSSQVMHASCSMDNPLTVTRDRDKLCRNGEEASGESELHLEICVGGWM